MPARIINLHLDIDCGRVEVLPLQEFEVRLEDVRGIVLEDDPVSEVLSIVQIYSYGR